MSRSVKQITTEGLVRGIGRWDLVALMINSMLGASIFGLPSTIYAQLGAFSLIALLACALVSGLIILCFAEVSSRFTGTGGQYLYAREAFGAAMAFEIGWLMWLQRVTSFASVCNLLVVTATYFWPAVNVGWPRTMSIGCIVLGFTVMNILGVRNTALVSNVITVSKVVPLLVFALAGFPLITLEPFSGAALPTVTAFSSSLLILISVFTGFEAVAIAAGETRDPQRNLPFAMLAALIFLSALYVLVQAVCIGTLPGLATSERPLTDAAAQFLGGTGASMISAAALFAMTGTLTVITLSGPRVLFAMAEHGQLPRMLRKTHSRFHTPHVAILLTAIPMFVVTVSGTFIYALTINMIIRLVNYAATCAALPLLRRRQHGTRAVFVAPAGTVISITSVTLCIWLLSSSGWREARDAIIAATCGLILYISIKITKTSGSMDA
jgi:APA family basic amino acid/polyamine antiporter